MPNKKYGLVFLLDALGASGFSEAQIASFLASRANIISSLNAQMQGIADRIETEGLDTIDTPKIFTFGDTVVITQSIDPYKCGLYLIEIIFGVVADHIYEAIEQGILYRGSFSIGEYYADEESNTVMGPALSDAAAWYEQSDWVGLSSTPHSSSVIEHIYVSYKGDKGVRKLRKSGMPGLVPYNVPMKGGKEMALYAVDWPACFINPWLNPLEVNETPLGRFLGAMSRHAIPKGTESKHKNTKLFFEERTNFSGGQKSKSQGAVTSSKRKE